MIRCLISAGYACLVLLVFATSALAQTPPTPTPTPTQCAPATSTVRSEYSAGREPHEATAIETLAAANRAARQKPQRTGFVQARQVYTYTPGAIFELYADPSFISAILLEPGETLNDVAAGDTSRWMVTETTTETETDGRTVVLVKPQATGIRTNIVLITDRRTYTIEAFAQSGSYSAQIAWCYPATITAAPSALSVDRLNFAYRIRTTKGRKPGWLPTRVFDDGRRTWIELPTYVAATDMPPVFVITSEGAELANYRVQGQRYMIDRLFDAAELRLGTRRQIVVRIERDPARRPPPLRGGRP